MNCPNNKSRNCCSACTACGTYVTIQGPPGPMGPKGPQGVRGDIGPKGDKGDTGETPAITVVEDTPLSYKLNFKTSVEDITTPNLFKPLEEYHVDLSATNSTLNIPLRHRLITIRVYRQEPYLTKSYTVPHRRHIPCRSGSRTLPQSFGPCVKFTLSSQTVVHGLPSGYSGVKSMSATKCLPHRIFQKKKEFKRGFSMIPKAP